MSRSDEYSRLRARSTRWLTFLVVAAIALLTIGMGPRVRSIVANSLQLAAMVVAIAIPVGTIVALALAKTTLRFRGFWLIAFVPMVFLPLYLHVAGWQAAFGVGGWLNPPTAGDPTASLLAGWTGAAWVHAAAAVPLVVLIMTIGLRHIDAAVEEAATLSSSPLGVIWHVTLPQARAAMVVALVWIAVSCACEISVTDFFGIRTFGEEIYTASALGGFPVDGPNVEAPLAGMSRWGGALLGTTGLAALLGVGLLVGTRVVTDHTVDRHQAAWRWRLARSESLAAILIVASVWLATIGLPILSLIVEAGRTARWDDGQPVLRWNLAHLMATLRDACWLHRREIVASCELAVAVAMTSTIVATLLAWTARAWTGARWIILTGIVIGIALPGPLLGVVVLRLFTPPAGSPLDWLATIYDRTWAGVLIVQCLRIVPLVTLVALAGMWQIPQSLLDAARADGARWHQTLLRIAIPDQLHTLAIVFVVSGMLSLGELAATVLVTPAGTPPLAVRLFSLLHYGIEGRVAALSLVVLAVAWIASALVLWLVRERPTRTS